MPLRPPAGFIRPGFDPLKNPNAPTAVAASGGDASASVSFTPPANVGGSAISAYYAVSNPGQITASAASSPVSVTGLANGTAYTFSVWALNTYGPGPFSAASGSVTPVANIDRAVYWGGVTESVYFSTSEYVTMSTTGNATTFASLPENYLNGAGTGSTTRGVMAVGRISGSTSNVISYLTFATTGTISSFGQTTQGRQYMAAVGSNTRGCFGGGYDGSDLSTIDYVTIATTGNASSFGGLSAGTQGPMGVSSPTRGVFAGGYISGLTSIISYITIATTGNTTSFGNLSTARASGGSCSSSTRGVFFGGSDGNSNYNNIQYVTIATTGNSVSFGQLISPKSTNYGGASNTTRGLTFAGWGATTSTVYSSSIQYITIASTGNAISFGTISQGVIAGTAMSSNGGGVQ